MSKLKMSDFIYRPIHIKRKQISELGYLQPTAYGKVLKYKQKEFKINPNLLYMHPNIFLQFLHNDL